MSSGANPTRFIPGDGGRVLMLSMRRINNVVANCMNYEFEDVVAESTGADRVEVGNFPALERSRRAYRIVRELTGAAALARAAAPAPPVVRLERDYDLFFPVFNHPHELYALAAVPDWRRRCRLAACFLNEPTRNLLPKYLLELLREFDYVFLGIRGPVDAVARMAGRPCAYLGSGTDALRFSPLPGRPRRAIDVCNIGRRSAVTHDALLAMARAGEIFYYFDTVAASGFDMKQRTFQVQDPAEHRFLFASLLRRTRYYVANRARANEPEFNGGQDEIAGRFYEGAAAGTIMIGAPPDADHFRQQFDWPDAVIRMPFDFPEIRRFLRELDQDPMRIESARARNAHFAALRHDWIYRYLRVLETLDLKPGPKVLERVDRLQALAGEALKMAPGTASCSAA